MIRKLTLVLCLLSIIPSVNAAGIHFRNILTADGLSNNHVNTIFRDSRGYMWIGTAYGLNRYDGYSMTVTLCDRNDPEGLHDNYIQSIQEDPDGNLWVRAADSYAILDPGTEKFMHLDSAACHNMGLPDTPTNLRIAGKDIWMTVRSYGIFVKYHNKKSLARISSGGVADNDITDIIIDDKTETAIAVNDMGTLFFIDYNTGNINRCIPAETERSPRQYSLFLDSKSRLWTYSISGVNVFDTKNYKRLDDKIHPTIQNRAINAICEDSDKRIWIGYDNDGLEVIGDDGNSQMLKYNPSDRHSLGNNSVTTLYNDGRGGIWVGTYKRGVSVYYPGEYKVDQIPLGDCNCIALADDDNHIWVGTDHDGLFKMDYISGTFSHIPDITEKIPHAVVCLASDGKNGVWLGSFNGGLRHYTGGIFRKYSAAEGISNENIWAIVPEEDGTLWLGTLGSGILHYNPAERRAEQLDTKNSALPSDYINAITKGNDGLLYIATADGFAILNPKNREITSQKGNRAGTKRLPALNVNQIIMDTRGLLWIGTREGLGVYDSATDSLYTVRLSEGNSSQPILGILESADRTMWVTADSKLYHITTTFNREASRYSFTTKAYGSGDGISTGAFNQRSMCQLPDGNVLAGNLYGIVCIDPEMIISEPHTPKVHFTGLYLKSQKVKIGEEYGGRVILPKAIDAINEIRLGYDQNDITIYFANDNFSKTEGYSYEYRLAGFEKDWVKCPQDAHSATFTNLSPGEYTIQVRSIDNNGTPSAEVTSLKITIGAPWWNTLWAKLIYIAIFVIAFFLVISAIKKREREKLKQQQRDEMAKKNEEVNQLKFRFFTNISHELRTPLTLILSPVEAMLKDDRDELDTKRLSTIRTNASRLLYLVNQLLDFRKNEMKGLTLHPSTGDILVTAKNAISYFAALAERRKIDLVFSSQADEIQSSYDDDKITKAIINLISNAIKYTPDGGRIEVSADRRDDNIYISVSDTGKGISEEDKKHIFERFYRSADTSDLNTGTGIGLSLVLEYVKLHEGSVELADNTPNGSIFTIIIPYRKPQDSSQLPAERGGTDADNDADSETAEITDNEPEQIENPNGSKDSILIVDDNRDLTDFLRDELSSEFDVETAADGLEALDILKKRRFNLIISDLMMPNLDGIQLCRTVRADSALSDIPFIMLTAKHDVETIIEGLTIGADDYIAKPFNNSVLMLKIRRLIALNKKGLKRALIEPTPADIKITSLDEQLIEKAVKYVEENMGRSDLTVEELAKQMAMSRVHLYKKVLSLTGKTPVEFIRILRLKRAAQYLRESQLTIAEIAYTVGFNNPKYFSKYFRDEFGIAPSEYQEKQGK